MLLKSNCGGAVEAKDGVMFVDFLTVVIPEMQFQGVTPVHIVKTLQEAATVTRTVVTHALCTCLIGTQSAIMNW